jgi:hypothetical protein
VRGELVSHAIDGSSSPGLFFRREVSISVRAGRARPSSRCHRRCLPAVIIVQDRLGTTSAGLGSDGCEAVLRLRHKQAKT